MAIAGPILAYAVYKLCCKMNVNKKVTVFLAAFLGDMFTYCVTSVAAGCGVSVRGRAVRRFTGEVPRYLCATQIPLAVIEGILTVVIVIALETYAKNELRSLSF